MSVHDIPREQQLLMLQNMQGSPAFALFCDEWDKSLATLQAKINDPDTSDQDTRELKLVRKQCAETAHPKRIVGTMIRTLSSAQKHQK